MKLFLQPEFFDIFGFLGFLYIFLLSLYALKNKNKAPRWSFILLLIIGLIGLAVDMAVVVINFL